MNESFCESKPVASIEIGEGNEENVAYEVSVIITRAKEAHFPTWLALKIEFFDPIVNGVRNFR